MPKVTGRLGGRGKGVLIRSQDSLLTHATTTPHVSHPLEGVQWKGRVDMRETTSSKKIGRGWVEASSPIISCLLLFPPRIWAYYSRLLKVGSGDRTSLWNLPTHVGDVGGNHSLSNSPIPILSPRASRTSSWVVGESKICSLSSWMKAKLRINRSQPTYLRRYQHCLRRHHRWKLQLGAKGP